MCRIGCLTAGHACRHRHAASAAVADRQANEATFSGRKNAGSLTDGERASPSRRWRSTGIELSAAVEEIEEDEELNLDDGDETTEVKGAKTVTMTPNEQDDYYLREFGNDPKYSKLFGARVVPP